MYCHDVSQLALGIVAAMADMMSKQSGKDVDPMRLKYGTGMMLMAAYAFIHRRYRHAGRNTT